MRALLGCWLLVGCALTPARVDKMAQKGDLDGLERAWGEADRAELRQAVLRGLGRVQDPRATALLVREAEHNSERQLRLLALQSLESHHGDQVLGALVRALQDPWPPLRDQAQNDLSRRGSAAAPVLLTAASASTHALVRASALRILVRTALADPSLRDQLSALLGQAARRDDAALVRAEAITGVGSLQLQAERRLVQDLLRADADPAVRQAAQRALEKLGAAPATQSVVVAVLPMQTTSDPEALRLGAQLTEYVAARLSGAKVCEVVDSKKMSAALDEMRKMGKAVYDGDAPNVPELGRFKIANQLVYGSVQRENLVYTIVLNRLDVSTLALVPGAAVTVKGYRGELDQLKEEATQRLIENFR